MNSMTGYGRATAENNRLRIEIALRSVNHRFLDSVVRIREPYRSFEAEVRARLGERLGRGRVEVSVEVTPLSAPVPRVRLDLVLVGKVLQELEALPTIGLEAPRLEARDLLAIPEAWTIEQIDDLPESDARALILECLDRALDELIGSRAQEGRSLFDSLQGSLGELAELVTSLAAQRESVRVKLIEALRRRLQETLAGTGLEGSVIDPARLEQETALLAEKSDVSEELDRLVGHCEHFAGALGSSEPVGRRLDFLAQEIARELNTLAAKCRDLEMARMIIDAKLYCERLREQAQNVE